jgi:hypothetical protein
MRRGRRCWRCICTKRRAADARQASPAASWPQYAWRGRREAAGCHGVQARRAARRTAVGSWATFWIRMPKRCTGKTPVSQRRPTSTSARRAVGAAARVARQPRPTRLLGSVMSSSSWRRARGGGSSEIPLQTQKLASMQTAPPCGTRPAVVAGGGDYDDRTSQGRTVRRWGVSCARPLPWRGPPRLPAQHAPSSLAPR